ncbi:site-specific integrase [Bradyrhizobium japonicum]|uniref:tyrosine-type recombinase/integrase n=1 Tax=Bradyrhizobium japonicum TaxID=375 RepID=UPI001BAD2962|nr:site-specific integrase [Bradyrhizobium japonicum]MBR0729638.1 site-specific integrase [Bradyrhizobium japonicum]
MRITTETVAAAMKSALPNKTKYHFDDDLAGFGFYRTTTGTGTFFAEFRPVAGGSKKRLKLGRVGTLKANEAREAARKAIANAALGKDLAKSRAEGRAAATVARLLELYNERTRDKRKASTADGYDLIAKVNIVPHIGATKAAAVTRQEVQRMHGKVGKARGHYAANRAVAVLKAAYAWGGKYGHVPEGFNPASGVDRYREEPRERFLTDAEMIAIGDAMTEAETIGLAVDAGTAKHAPVGQRVVMSPYATAAVRLIMLTGARLREILHLRWDEVDLERGILRLPDSKTGKKLVYLPTAAIDIIKGLTPIGAFVIAGESAGTKREKPRADLKKPWAAILKRAGVSGIRIHDLRHTFASIGVGDQMGLPVIGALLGHSNAATTKRYAHAADEVQRRAVEAIGGKIAAALGGGK